MELGHERVLTIKDSGNRTEFASGAVRDIQEGKGRCDLLPLDVVGLLLATHEQEHKVVDYIYGFTKSGDPSYLIGALSHFCALRGWDTPTMILEVAIHFENGAKKYGERNWEKGIPVQRYVDSGIRHYLKWLRGDNDENHSAAFCWNMTCAAWTCKHKPELNDYAN